MASAALTGCVVLALTAGCDSGPGQHHRMMHGPGAGDPAGLPAPGTGTGYALAREICTQCHELPAPGLHTSGEWQEVIARMTGYMRSAGKRVPDRAERRALVAYYSGNAGGNSP